MALELTRLQERVRVLESDTARASADAEKATAEAIKASGALSTSTSQIASNERECQRRHEEILRRIGSLESHEDAGRKAEFEALNVELRKLREAREETSQHWTRWAVATIVSFAIAVGLLFAGRALATSSSSSTSGGSAPATVGH